MTITIAVFSEVLQGEEAPVYQILLTVYPRLNPSFHSNRRK